MYYIERERAHPFRPFLHYNSWYDIAWADRKFDEAQCIAAIECFGQELIQKRGGVMDSFVFDDGWDDNTTLWRFHSGFPKGFAPVRNAAARYHASIGAWLSPFGGYGEARKQRLDYGKTQGFETNANGFSLAGPIYYARFRDVCAGMMRDYGVDFFKFDGMGTGGAASAEGGGEYLDDIEALMRMVAELREVNPHLYISATTGTWCSPYFLWHADSIWRGGADMGFHGAGSKRQQWITYRDTYTYRNIVQQGPLYPLNSLMNQGIAQARFGPAAELGNNLKEMADEMWSFFGTGTGLQELYIAPQMLTPPQWDILAASAAWARRHAQVFVDAHWIGGNPGASEVYGVAAWSPEAAVLMLRNPAETHQTFDLNLAMAFELPERAPTSYRLSSPRPDTQNKAIPRTLAANTSFPLHLDGFEVLILDATPE